MTFIGFFRVLWAYLKGIRRYLTPENLAKAYELARAIEGTPLRGSEKLMRAAEKLEEYLFKKYGEKVPKWIIHTLIQIALGKVKKAGQED